MLANTNITQRKRLTTPDCEQITGIIYYMDDNGHAAVAPDDATVLNGIVVTSDGTELGPEMTEADIAAERTCDRLFGRIKGNESPMPKAISDKLLANIMANLNLKLSDGTKA